MVLVRKEKNEYNVSETAQKELVDKLNTSIDELRKRLDLLQQENISKHVCISELQEMLERGNEENKVLKAEIEKRDEVEKINKQIEKKNMELRALEEQREKTVNNRKYYFGILIEIVCVLIFVVFLILTILKIKQTKDIGSVTGLLVGTAVPLLTFLWRIKDLYLCDKVKKYQLREEQYAIWDKEHPERGNIMNEIKALEDKKQSIGGYMMKQEQ